MVGLGLGAHRVEEGGVGWAPSEYNELKTRRLGRCSDLLNLCQGCAAR